MAPGHVADARRLEEFENLLLELRQGAAHQIVVVEGDRDVQALRDLGIGGEHRKVHAGRSLEVWIDELAASAGGRNVLLLLDWDRTGRRLATRLEQGLRARVRVDMSWRKRLAGLTRCKCLEDVPAELAALRRGMKNV